MTSNRYDPMMVYIMGRGHSGTTIIDAILAQSKGVTSYGELVSGVGNLDAEVCSCGERVVSCPFWSDVAKELEKENITIATQGRDALSIAHVKYFFPILINFYRKRLRQSEIFDQKILSIVGNKGDASVVVDSSKEFTRALYLSKSSLNVKFIFMTRDPERVYSSYYSRLTKGKPLKFLRREVNVKSSFAIVSVLIAISWLVGNALGLIVERIAGKDRVLRVRYEDLVEDSSACLRKIENFLKIPLSESVKASNGQVYMEMHHTIGGNEFRHDGRFRFDPSRQEKHKLPNNIGRIIRVITYPLRKVFNY